MLLNVEDDETQDASHFRFKADRMYRLVQCRYFELVFTEGPQKKSADNSTNDFVFLTSNLKIEHS